MSRRAGHPIYLRLFIGDWASTTSTMNAEERGALISLIVWAYGNAADLATVPDEDVILARIAGLSLKRWRKVRGQVLLNFNRETSGWVHEGLRAEAARFAQVSADQRRRRTRGQPPVHRAATSQSQSQNSEESIDPSVAVPTPTAVEDDGPTPKSEDAPVTSTGQRPEINERRLIQDSATHGDPTTIADGIARLTGRLVPSAEGLDAYLAKLEVEHGKADLSALKPRPRANRPAPPSMFQMHEIAGLEVQYPRVDVQRVARRVEALAPRKPIAYLNKACRQADQQQTDPRPDGYITVEMAKHHLPEDGSERERDRGPGANRGDGSAEREVLRRHGWQEDGRA